MKRLPQKDSLTDLISLRELQDMQDGFSEVANVSIRIVDPKGNFVTDFSRPPSLCTEFFPNNKGVNEKICKGCLPAFLGGEGIVDDDLSFECLPGLKNYMVPLKAAVSKKSSRIFGYMIVGPVIFMKRKDKEEFKEVAQELHVDLEEFWSFILELRVFSYNGIRSFLNMADNLTSHLLTLAYGKLTMQEKILKNFSHRLVKQAEDKSVGLNEFLELFLDFIVDIVGGARSSVMLLDARKRTLVIKASRGLTEDVESGARVKLGDGLSGFVAQTRKPLLINDEVKDETILARLIKPDLHSSLIVPIVHHHDVYGVVNVSCLRSAPVSFNASNLALLTKAAGLAGVAIGQLQS